MNLGGAPVQVAVTGGGGFLGEAIVRRLKADGHRVRSFSRRRHRALSDLGVRQILGDISDADAVFGALAGAAVVFHTAAKAGVWGDAAEYETTNVTGTANVIDACRHHGIRTLVYTSSPSVVFDGSDMAGVDETVPYPAAFHAPYPKSKAAAERMVREAAGDHLKTVSLRPHLIWGPGDNHLIPRILARAARLRRVGKGTNRVDTIYIDNAAEAHILAAEALMTRPEISGNVYFISQDEPIPLWDMVDAILAAGGLPPVTGTVSAVAAQCIGAVLETVYRLLRLPGEPRMTRFVASELATSHWFDISAAKRDLGYVPKVSTAEGLERLAHWLKDDPYGLRAESKGSGGKGSTGPRGQGAK
ncbi:MAG: NAD-dependent epimerase/dehydratase family protein [Pseudomonadota bacterium]